MIKIDVIILSWDRIIDTMAAIQSALDQTNVDLQVIVVDQGSKPENLAQLKAFCAKDNRIILILNETNNGVPGGRNQASFVGSGTYIVALDNDAVFEDEHQLLKTIDIMETNTKLGVLAYRIKCYGEDIDDKSSWPYSSNPIPQSTTIFKTTRFVGAGHAIRRDVFERIGGYDNKLFFMHEEVDLAKRIMNAGYEIEYNPTVVVRHKVSPEHRVSWSGKRFFYDVRNRTYLHFKLKTPFPTMVFHTFLLLLRGIKLGYVGSSFKGLAAGLILLPHAVKHRFHDKFSHETEESRHYYRMCNPPIHSSPFKRIYMRLKDTLK
jgi:GT2 family glycosyltransferase